MSRQATNTSSGKRERWRRKSPCSVEFGVLLGGIIVAGMHHTHRRAERAAHFDGADDLVEHDGVKRFVPRPDGGKRRVRLVAGNSDRFPVLAEFFRSAKIVRLVDQPFSVSPEHGKIIGVESALFQEAQNIAIFPVGAEGTDLRGNFHLFVLLFRKPSSPRSPSSPER